ncbi:MAG: hypothetical protein ABWZ99_13185 [Ilumatobacteraceae bacterium]
MTGNGGSGIRAGGRGDIGRAAVYACEIAAFDGTDLEAVQPFDDVAELIGRVTSGPWWPGPIVRVEVARRGAVSSGAHGPVGGGGSVTVRLAPGQATTATAAHELAHALAGVGHGHDPLYRCAYLDVIRVITNIDPTDRRGDIHVRQLADAFASAGLSVAERRWPSPDPSVGGPIVL